MSKLSRRKFTAEFKTKVVLESLKEHSSIEELARNHKVHPSQINTWKREFLGKASVVFGKKEREDQKPEADAEKLYAQIDQLKVENDSLKKRIGVKSLEERRNMIEQNHSQISIFRQCEILNLHRSGLYYQPVAESKENLDILRLLDEQYHKTPFYGIRKLTEWLRNMDYQINHKRVRRLMKLMGWKTCVGSRIPVDRK